MPQTLARVDVQTIALALATSGRSRKFDYLTPNFKTLEVGQVIVLDDADLNNYDESLPSIVKLAGQGVALNKDSKTKMRNVFAALLRELRLAHGKQTDDTSLDLRAVYCMVDELDNEGNPVTTTETVHNDETDEDEEVQVPVKRAAYGVERVK